MLLRVGWVTKQASAARRKVTVHVDRNDVLQLLDGHGRTKTHSQFL
jgi:hypothetical protein